MNREDHYRILLSGVNQLLLYTSAEVFTVRTVKHSVGKRCGSNSLLRLLAIHKCKGRADDQGYNCHEKKAYDMSHVGKLGGDQAIRGADANKPEMITELFYGRIGDCVIYSAKSEGVSATLSEKNSISQSVGIIFVTRNKIDIIKNIVTRSNSLVFIGCVGINTSAGVDESENVSLFL